VSAHHNDTEIDMAASMVEAMIANQGIDPESVRVNTTDQGKAWSLVRGSAAIAIFVRPAREGEPSARLRLISPVIKIEESVRPELFKTLLELNASGLAGMAFAVHHHHVVIVVERRVRDLESAEVAHLIEQIGVVADHYADHLIERFGGVKAGDESSADT
jgi:hypothetical protein